MNGSIGWIWGLLVADLGLLAGALYFTMESIREREHRARTEAFVDKGISGAYLYKTGVRFDPESGRGTPGSLFVQPFSIPSWTVRSGPRNGSPRRCPMHP